MKKVNFNMSRRKKPVVAHNVKFTGIADRGKAVGRTEDNQVVFVKGPVPGDIADVLLLKKRKEVYQGIIQEYKTLSEDRVTPICDHFELCGGCKWQHLDYKKQLEEKERVVKDAFERIAKIHPQDFQSILGGDKTSYYRNKLEFSFSNKRWLSDEEVKSDQDFGDQNVLGFHAPGSYAKIVDIEKCHLQADPSNEIRNFIRNFTLENAYSYWDANKNQGLMRNIIIRTSENGELMLTVVFSENDQERIQALLNALAEKFPSIVSLLYVVNQKVNDTLYDQEFIVFKGKKEIKENLGDLEFIISPKSFFQTNTSQSKNLYDIAIDFAGLSGNELVYDLYSGIGSIALYLADKIKKVIGIELIEEAVIDARRNAKLNKINNAEFFVGDVKDVLKPSFEKADLIVVDPPRAGLHKDIVHTILQLAPEKLVYVSCNPATQARDVALLNEKYDLIKLRPVDMFPHTHHIESVALLHLRG